MLPSLNGATRIHVTIGDPIAQVKSPAGVTQGFAARGADAIMIPLQVRSANIEDFFRLLTDAILYYPHKLIPSHLFTPIFQAAVSALALEQRDPLTATLHYLRDVIGYGGDNPPAGPRVSAL